MMLPRGRASQSASPGYFIFPTLSQIIVPTEAARITLQMPNSAAPLTGIVSAGLAKFPPVEPRPGLMPLFPAGRDASQHPALR